tara:strand:- start:12333 stop:14696 length:2364 start_codon:yes stop_codon:yes gene_type:complete
MNKQFYMTAIAAAVSTAMTAQAAEIETIEVTATKRVENAQTVPVSVSALSADELKNLKIRDTTEISAQVPNMQISTPGGDSYPIISIRGISMDDYSINQSSSVAIYVDEVYKGNPSVQSGQMFDLQRIEVLRGPQGTLFGKNSTGGLVNFITKGPSWDDGGYLTAGFGNNSRKEFKGAYETTLSEQLAVRVAGTYTEMDGWKKNAYPGGNDSNAIDEWAARASFNYLPSDDVDIMLKISASKANPYNYAYTNIPGEAGYGAGYYELFNNSEVGLPALFGVTPPAGAPQNSYFVPQGQGFDEIQEDNVVKREIENTAVSLNITWDVNEDYTLTSITSFDSGDITIPEGDGTPIHVNSVTISGDTTQFTQDLRLTSNFDGKFNYILGAFISQEEIDAPTSLNLFQDLDLNVDGSLDYLDCYDPLAAAFGLEMSPNGQQVEDALLSEGASLGLFAGLGCSLQNNYTQEKNSIGLYFDGSYDLTEDTTLRFGARSTNDVIKLSDFNAGYYGSDGILVVPTITQELLPEDEIDENEWSGKVSIDHMLESGDLVYLSYNRGYRSGAFNGQSFNDPSEAAPVEPEILDAFEVGFKADFLQRQLRINGAAFYYDYEGQQFINVDPNTAAQTLQNIDSSTIKGLEFDLTAALSDNLMLRAGFGYLDTEVDGGVISGVDVAGNNLSQSPEYNGNISLDYYQTLNDLGSIQWHIDANWTDDHYFDIHNSESIAQDAYALVNARITWTSVDDKYEVAIWGKNLTDEEYLTKAFDLSGFGGIMAHYGQTVSYGAELTATF